MNRFGEPGQMRGALPYLRDGSGRAVQTGIRHGLNTVNHGKGGARGFQMVQYHADFRFHADQKVRAFRSQPRAAQPDLLRALFPGDVQHAVGS